MNTDVACLYYLDAAVVLLATGLHNSKGLRGGGGGYVLACCIQSDVNKSEKMTEAKLCRQRLERMRRTRPTLLCFRCSPVSDDDEGWLPLQRQLESVWIRTRTRPADCSGTCVDHEHFLPGLNIRFSADHLVCTVRLQPWRRCGVFAGALDPWILACKTSRAVGQCT